MVFLIFSLNKKALLRGVGSNSHLQHLQLVPGAQPSAWELMSVLSPRDVAAPFPVAGSAAGKVAHTSRGTGMDGHTGCQRQGAAFNTPIKHTPDSQVPSSSSAGRVRGSLVRAHTHLHAPPKHQHSPSAHPTSLPTSWALLPSPQVPSWAAGPAWGLQ